MALEFQDILYEKTGAISRITINRPHAMNSFTDVTLTEIITAINDSAIDNTIGVVVITGAGDRAFCAGGDVKWERGGGLESKFVNDLDLRQAMRSCLKPIIARVNGWAVGGGNHLAYFADLTIAAEHAQFGQNGPTVGSPADGFVVNYLVQVVGAKKAREIWYTCRRYSAQEALEMGLVNAVVPMDQLDAEVERWANDILDKSPTCISILKASFERALDMWREPAFSLTRQMYPHYFETGEAKEGQNAFLEKRKPDFSRYRQPFQPEKTA